MNKQVEEIIDLKEQLDTLKNDYERVRGQNQDLLN